MNQAYLFNKGLNYQSYNLLGAHPLDRGDQPSGYRFAVWAPFAKNVSVVGDFNNWDRDANPLERDHDTGIWQGVVTEAKQWQRYSYMVHGADDRVVQKADPFARHAETRPNIASILYDGRNDYEWEDKEWLANRPSAFDPQPLNIYEVHLGSWRRYEDGNVYNYRTTAVELAEYLLEMGYIAVEVMPITEYPLDASWGYQVTGYFAPTSRYGTPADFKFFVDHMHANGIRVILDWVPAHFPKDSFGLARFDGTPLFEYADSRIGEHKSWGTLVFDYSKKEVLSFLLSSAWFWLDEFHIDGFRFDAVSSMIYLDYDRDEFVRNVDGGNENHEALDFLRNINDLMHKHFPGVLMIAEESTAYPYITKPTSEGGLGFSHKWNMGWMHDTLKYMSLDYIHRPFHHNQLSFSMTYAFSENYILSLSHDEVVHGKKSLIDRMPGDIWRKFANYRAMMMYMMSHPGGKLNFMGGEFAQFIEWRFKEELQWFMLQHENHQKFHNFMKVLNHFYLDSPAFWEQDNNWMGFEWNQADDYENSVYIYTRVGKYENQIILVILNLTPAVIENYELEAPRYGSYRVVLNSDDSRYGGSCYWGEDSADTEHRFVTSPESQNMANQMFDDIKDDIRNLREELKEKRDQLENARLDLAESYRQLLEYQQPGIQVVENGNMFRGLDVPLADVPEILVDYEQPLLTIDLPPLCGLYLIYEGSDADYTSNELDADFIDDSDDDLIEQDDVIVEYDDKDVDDIEDI